MKKRNMKNNIMNENEEHEKNTTNENEEEE